MGAHARTSVREEHDDGVASVLQNLIQALFTTLGTYEAKIRRVRC